MSLAKIKIEGASAIIRALKKQKPEQRRGLVKGLVLAGLFLQRKSQQVVPVDTGALKASAFTRKTGVGRSTNVTVGYTMDYAVFVHENLDARHKPGKTAKYLERPARKFMGRMRDIIKKTMEASART